MQCEEDQKASIMGSTLALPQSLRWDWKISSWSSWWLSLESSGCWPDFHEWRGCFDQRSLLESAFCYRQSQGSLRLFRQCVTRSAHPQGHRPAISPCKAWALEHSFPGVQRKRLCILGGVFECLTPISDGKRQKIIFKGILELSFLFWHHGT